MYYGFYYDWTYILVLIGVVLSLLASSQVKGTFISWPLIIIGLFMNGQMSSFLIDIGILLFMVAVAFHLITLPVEINASRRAVKVLGNSGMLREDEVGGVKKVLRAAAMTYVASAAAMILQLLRLLILTNGRRRND